MRARLRLWVAGSVVAAIHVLIVFAGFFAPYDPTEQHREIPLATPFTINAKGDGRAEWFTTGWRYRVLGVVTCSRHLFGASAGGQVFVLGTDPYGRDQLSRVLCGGQISVLAGSIAAFLALLLGLVFGTVAGFYGGWTDEILMRLAELFLALPWLYLLLAARAALPDSLTPGQTFLLVASIIGATGWARPARLIRGLVLSAREREYVHAARGFGASHWYLLTRHIVPETWGVLLTQAGILIPQFIMAEVLLAFFGLGVGEPVPSWGSTLSYLRQPWLAVTAWWMLAPLLVMLPLFLGYHALASTLQQRAAAGSG
ncbi:MAG: binding-protein-dependent transport system inner rane component [Bryobacterales bacterium]|nr:binding-protein-dependent transport system inner rane component [Bryobacterales bacterium]